VAGAELAVTGLGAGTTSPAVRAAGQAVWAAMAAGRGRCGRAAVSLRPSPLPKPTLAPRAGHTWGTQLHRRDTWAGGTLL